VVQDHGNFSHPFVGNVHFSYFWVTFAAPCLKVSPFLPHTLSSPPPPHPPTFPIPLLALFSLSLHFFPNSSFPQNVKTLMGIWGLISCFSLSLASGILLIEKVGTYTSRKEIEGRDHCLRQSLLSSDLHLTIVRRYHVQLYGFIHRYLIIAKNTSWCEKTFWCFSRRYCLPLSYNLTVLNS
jgi:hypothetical protein